MTTNQTERVSDEELDQMIWKLERDGMTPKMLSLMRELREVRRAKGEPVAWMYEGEDGREYNGHNEFSGGGKGVPLYAATPAAVVPTNVADAIERLKQRLADCHRFNYCAEAVREVEDACRAAMLQDGNHNERHLDMVDHSGEANEKVHDQTQFKPVADLYGITSPTGSETSFTFDAIEAVNFIEGGWSVQEYVELERYQEAMIGNSPATPDGWKLVPEEPTHEMLEAGDAQFGTYDVYRRMIEAVSKEVG